MGASVLRGWRRAGVVLLALGVLGLPAAGADVIPGTAEEYRLHLGQAQACYAWVDYRCVIRALEGLLLVGRALPAGLSEEEIREGYELLGLGYLSLGLYEEGELAFRRLLERDSGYCLERVEASPQQKAVVIRLSEELAAVAAGESLGRWVGLRIRDVVLAQLRWRDRALSEAEAVGAVLGRLVEVRARSVVRQAQEFKWGPWELWLGGGGGWRGLVGRDGSLWGGGWGAWLGAGISRSPLFVRLLLAWSGHGSQVKDPVMGEQGRLHLLDGAMDFGVSGRLWWVHLEAGCGVGAQWLWADGRGSALVPRLSLSAGMEVGLWSGLRLFGRLESPWVFARVGPEGALQASVSWWAVMGVAWRKAIAP